jgi:L-lactate dehydrogenase (cytochrome)
MSEAVFGSKVLERLWGDPERRVARAFSIEDLRLIAKRRIPRVCFDFVDGASEDEVTMGLNRRGFEELTFRPRYLVDVAKRDLSTEVCGTPISLPVMFGPTGLTRIVSANAEVDAARAAAAAGTVYCPSTATSTSMEHIAAANGGGSRWFQLYLWRDREVYESFVRRAQGAGYEGLVVTVDVPIAGKRERDYRNGFTLPLRLPLRQRIEAARHLEWIWGYLTGPPLTFANLAEEGFGDDAALLGQMVNKELTTASSTYQDLRSLREIWPGKLLVKGTMSVADAEQAVACGVDGIIVSNHGGRQLDGLPATIDVLPSIVAAVGDRVEVLLDSGIRRGSDVVKALALGAKAVLIGRPYLWGLAAGGQYGAARALEILREEIDLCLAMIGCDSVRNLDPSVIEYRPGHRFASQQPPMAEAGRA